MAREGEEGEQGEVGVTFQTKVLQGGNGEGGCMGCRVKGEAAGVRWMQGRAGRGRPERGRQNEGRPRAGSWALTMLVR